MRALLNAPWSVRRNVPLLSVGWGLAVTVSMTMVSISVLTGNMLAEDKSLAALPIMLQWIGTAGTTLPVSLFMQRFGRRAGFLLGAALIATGAAIAIEAVFARDFLIYCLATPFVGAGIACNWYYRFAAVDVSDHEFRSRAISLVLAGGVIAALVAPNLAIWSKDLLAPAIFAGCFTAIIGIAAVMAVIAAFVDIPPPTHEDLHGGRPIGEIVRQPVYLVAIFGGIVAYSVMVLMMSVSPLAMADCGLDFNAVALVIQWHVLGMYIPSFFTGHLIRRFDTLRIMQTGVGLITLSILVSVGGLTLTHFWLTMAILGVGWNFLFVGSTTLLTEAYTPAERAKAQGVNDMLIFSITGIATFGSGSLLHHVGWHAVGLSALPAIVLVLLATLWLAGQRRRAAA